ncbi:MAG: peptide-N-glycosidase F-related protein [Bacteroidales bacterium]|nr:peptide-N-glycosidase F-related protein [Bacteroidales bacterium]
MRTSLLLLALLPMLASAQVKIPKNANHFTYWQFEYGNERTDTTVITVLRDGDCITILTPEPEGEKIPGYCRTFTEVNYAADSITVTATYPDSTYYYRTPLSRSDLEWSTVGTGRALSTTWKTSINSNTLEFEMDERTPLNATPLPHYGLTRGVLRSFTRNGQLRLKLASVGTRRGASASDERLTADAARRIPTMRRVSPRELDRIMKERLVVTTRVFDHAQIHWGAKNAHIEGSIWNVPFDSVMHFAGGTVVLKRVRLPQLPPHYQHFVELYQQSNGDAYDRTGSVFVMPMSSGTALKGFFRGINEHPDSLPVFTGRDGQRYQGMMATDEYMPATEWVRFFTPFGVGHFNERMAGYGIDWRDETYYRQEISDVYFGGDVIVGAWIGNYDGGGHLLTMDIKSYPNSYTDLEFEVEGPADAEVLPLFNTCNVLEMAGQNYGKLFATDSLTVTFTIGNDAVAARLRYISTGHGGWGEGDEFVPKQNTILIDGRPAFTHTPWRQDCGCYRDLNPVSGNFWNGLSSSDFSRSGWCPGTATQPVYFDLTPWADGKEHTLTVAIPQGKPVEGMFSHWAVSGALIVEY